MLLPDACTSQQKFMQHSRSGLRKLVPAHIVAYKEALARQQLQTVLAFDHNPVLIQHAAVSTGPHEQPKDLRRRPVQPPGNNERSLWRQSRPTTVDPSRDDPGGLRIGRMRQEQPDDIRVAVQHCKHRDIRNPFSIRNPFNTASPEKCAMPLSMRLCAATNSKGTPDGGG